MRRHSGFTLIEVLLTLSLVVILAAISWPALTRPWASQRLRGAADQIRADWLRARVKSMSSGQTYVFQYEPGAVRYQIQCSGTEEGLLDDSTDASGGSGAAEPGAPQQFECSLPDGVAFVSGVTAPDNRALPDAGQDPLLMLDPNAAQADAAGGSPSIRFYPDGTTSTARLLLKNQNDQSIELRLRGLTGMAAVGEVKPLGEQATP